MAGAGCAAMAWLGLYGFAWNDYDTEARPTFDALVHGHVLEFLRLAPAYGGSLVERAPFALLPGLWGGGELAVYRMVALPCLLATAVLGVWLVARMRSERRSTFARAVTMGVCVANPLTLLALEFGHPEELLGACLCVAAVLLAGRSSTGRAGPLWVGVILGLAIANKEWALLAVGPVLLALPARRRLPCLASAGGVAAAVLAPLALVGSGGFLASTRALATAPSAIFQPWQVWWFLGASNHVPAPTDVVRTVPIGAALSTHPEWRLAPGWLAGVPHPLILVSGLALTVALWLRQRRRRSATGPRLSSGSGARVLSVRDALLALALALLLRCMLDTWDTVYYLLPFVFALLAWEVRGPVDRLPVLALSSTVLAWIDFQWLPSHASPDAQAAFFLAWSLPLAAALGLRLFRPNRSEMRERSWIVWCARGQKMTVSALGRLVRTSWPSPATTARSSIRTPRRPGR
jgi:Glycosyltransferase family 87